MPERKIGASKISEKTRLVRMLNHLERGECMSTPRTVWESCRPLMIEIGPIASGRSRLKRRPKASCEGMPLGRARKVLSVPLVLDLAEVLNAVDAWVGQPGEVGEGQIPRSHYGDPPGCLGVVEEDYRKSRSATSFR